MIQSTIKVEDLISTIARFALSAIACTLAMEDYRNVSQHWPLKGTIGKPYGITARGAYRSAIDWQKAFGKPGPMIPFVESGTLHEGDMRQCFLRDNLAEPIPVKKELAPVQAADLLAWEVARHNRTESFDQISSLIGTYFPYPNRQRLQLYPGKKMRAGMEASGAWRRKELSANAVFSFHNSPRSPRKRTIV